MPESLRFISCDLPHCQALLRAHPERQILHSILTPRNLERRVDTRPPVRLRKKTKGMTYLQPSQRAVPYRPLRRISQS
jgi:hypothetical protein